MVLTAHCSYVLAVLRTAGFRADWIHAGMGPEYSNILARFNDKKDKLQFLVLSTQLLSSMGLNCHMACSEGLITTFCSNVATLQQAMGRLFRIGQTDVVK